MSTIAVRHPLGLPAGSIRALLTFIVLGLIWALMCLQKDIPLYLIFLMFLILGSFFAAHGHSIAGSGTSSASPLYLPRGSLRTLIFLGFAAVLGWRYYNDHDLNTLFQMKQAIADRPYLPLLLLGAFFGGVIFSRVVERLASGPQGPSPWFQDVRAWLALIAALFLAVEVIIQLVINPGQPEDKQLELPQWQAFLGAVVAFYFGARS
jgi:hypothetical protein